MQLVMLVLILIIFIRRHTILQYRIYKMLQNYC